MKIRSGLTTDARHTKPWQPHMLETEANMRSNIGPPLVSEITSVQHKLEPTRAGRFEITLVTIPAKIEGGTCRYRRVGYRRKVSVAEKPLATRPPLHR